MRKINRKQKSLNENTEAYDILMFYINFRCEMILKSLPLEKGDLEGFYDQYPVKLMFIWFTIISHQRSNAQSTTMRSLCIRDRMAL